MVDNKVRILRCVKVGSVIAANLLISFVQLGSRYQAFLPDRYCQTQTYLSM